MAEDTTLVTLSRCGLHTRKSDPPCFHNLGGQYRIIRAYRFTTFFLEHVSSGCLGLADVRDISFPDP